MKNVLVVDDDPIMLQAFSGLLKSQGGFFNVLCASGGKQALQLIERQPVHIVITGLRMPEMDGFELMTHLAESYPQMRVIVMADQSSPMFRARLRQFPSAIHFDRSMDIGLLTRRILTELQIEYGGQLHGISLSSFLQMIELEGRTCMLKISAKAKTGFLIIVDGVLVAARCNDLRAKPAALQILTWDNVSIDIDYTHPDVEPEITEPLMALLLESGRLTDERTSRHPDQRAYQRANCLVAVDYDLSDWSYQCFLRDISLGGAYIETAQQIQPGQKIILTLSAPGTERNCAISGRVVRRDDKGIGVQFESLSLHQKQVLQAMMSGRVAAHKDADLDFSDT
jgi:CheY-like chemotaxis protein